MTITEHWLQPGELMSLLQLQQGMSVAVIETEPDYYGKHVRTESGTPVHASLAPIAHGSCHMIILADVLHLSAGQNALLEHAKHSLAEGGRLVITCPYHAGDRRDLQEVLCTVERASWTLQKLHSRWKEGFVMEFEPTDESVQS